MELTIAFIIFFSLFININGSYILIPFDSMIYNPKNDPEIIQDVFSFKFSEDIYFNLTIGNPKQSLPILIRLDKYELKIKEPNYISILSESFKYDGIIMNKIKCKENFYFMTLNTKEELNDFFHNDKISKLKNEKELVKEYKNISFVYLNDTTNNRFLETELLDYEYNKILNHNYGMLGLRNRKYENELQLLEILKKSKGIDKSIFSFIFNKDRNSEHLGYLIIGEQFIDYQTEYEEINKTNFALRNGAISWDFNVETIYSKSNKDNLDSFYDRNVNVELRVELSYIFGTRHYKNFIDKEFFSYLVEKNVCKFKHLFIDWSYEAYVCDGKSNIFIDYYNNKFPELVFILNNIDDKFVLTKEDLFFKNPNNKSDTNIYFSIYFHNIQTTTWRLGRLFLQKYRFSFDHDRSIILYHKRKINNDIKENTVINDQNNERKSHILKIIIISFFGLIIFILGIIFHKSIMKLPRKIKANELDDKYYYSNEGGKEKLASDFDINNNIIKEKEKNLYVELGTKNN